MENGESLLDVIDETSELFGNNDIAQFNWADEILAENEADVSGSVATEHGNLTTSIIPTNVLMTSQNYITSSNPSQTLTIASQHPFFSSSATNSDLQHGATIVGQTVVNPVQNVGQSVTAQLLQQGNQQFILKTAGGQLHLTSQAQLQFQQPVMQSGVHSSSSQFQQPMAQTHSNRQSPALTASPLNRSMTPSSVALPVSFVTTPSSQTISHLKSASPAPNVNILHLPQVQQAQPQLQLAPGTVLQIPGASGGQHVVNANLLQGLSSQQQAALVNQQGTLVNTQNTVIQNPNVVNLNVAHHMPLGVQTAPQAPFNIQGTLIQTPEGKSILIPSQNLAQAVNIQPLGQLSLPTQLTQTQNPNSVGNMIKLQAPQGTERSTQGISQLVLNHQGQQVLIQRAPSTGGQPQNIVVRTIPQSGIVQLQQTPQRTAQAQTALQGQQVKFIQQGTSQASSNVTVNIGGQNVNLGQLALQNVQFVQGNTTVSSASVVPDQTNSQQQISFQGQGHDLVAAQERRSVTSQQNFIAPVHQQQNVVTNSQLQGSVSNPANIAAQNYQGLSNMQQLMQKLRGSKVVTLQTMTDSSTVQTTLTHTQPFVARVTTGSPNVNIFQIKREKIDSSASDNSNISSSGPNTIKSLMFQKQAGTLGTAKFIVKQEPVVKLEPSSVVSSCSQVSHTRAQSAAGIEGLLSASAFTTAHVTSVTTTISQSAGSVLSSLVSNTAQQNVSSVDIKPFASNPQGISSFVNTVPKSNLGASQISSSSSILSALTGSNTSSITSTTNTLSGNLNSISPQESSTSMSPMNGSSKPVGGTLQTIHLPPELQQQLQRVQQKMQEVNSMKNLSTVEKKNKQQQLNMIQKKILLRGRVLATTKAEPHHIKQGLQALATLSGDQLNESSRHLTSVSQSPLIQSLSGGQHSSNSSQQSVELDQHSVLSAQESVPSGRQSVSSTQHLLSSEHHQENLSGLQASTHQTSTQKMHGHSFLSAVEQSLSPTGHPAYIKQSLGVLGQETSREQHSRLSRSPAVSSAVTSVGDRSTALLNAVSSPAVVSGYSHLASSNSSIHSTSMPSALSSSVMTSVVTNNSLPLVVTNGNLAVTVTSSNITPIFSTGETIASQSQPGSQVSSSLSQEDPNKAVPTQIKIGNKILTLNLTKQQKDKVQSYLDRMTPEQQQQYLQTQQGILNRIQRQQELNAQIQAQVEAQKQKQVQVQNSQAETTTSPQKITLVPQKNIIPGKTIETAGSNSPSPGPEVKVIPVPKIAVNQVPTTESPFRGQKRSFMDIPKGTLINQQLRQDQNLAVNPDTKKPFKSRSDACRSLLRYHVFQSYGPSEQEFEKFDSCLEDIASDLLRKEDRMMDKFRILMLQESMRTNPSAELVMLQRIQNQELKKLIEEEKKIAKNSPDSFKPMPMKYLISESDGDTADEDVKQELDSSDSSPRKAESNHEKVKREPVSDSEASSEPDYKKMKTLVIRLDSRLNFQSSFKRNSLESRSSLDDSETVENESAKEHMDTSTQESDDDADSVKTEIVDGPYTQEELVQDEIVEEEIVTDFNANEGVTETLTETPTDYSKPLIRTKASFKHFDSQSVRNSMEDENAKAALSISSTEDSQTNDDYDESNESSCNASPPSFSQYSSEFEHHGNTELASETIYFNQAQGGSDAPNNEDQYSDAMAVEQSRKYIPEHSPVSNDSFDNENINTVDDFNSSGYFDKFKMYQPITESLTDSEENSYYSADNTVEQTSARVDDADNENVPWSQPSGSSQVQPYCDSEHSEDSDPEVKAQMESAINSILSLNQGAPDGSQQTDYSFSQSNQVYSGVPTYLSGGDGDSQSEANMKELDTELSTSCSDNDTANESEGDDDVVIVNDDIDAAVQSILM